MRVDDDRTAMDVGIVTVGDELLSGDTVNENAAWLGRELTARGVDVRRVTVVPDEIDEIAAVVDRDRERYDAVIVTGGLGPTHDDRTIEAIAEAFDRPLVEDEDALAWLVDNRGYAADGLAEGTAHLPAGATPIHNDEGVAPGAHVGNVYVLPGVPAEMQAMFGRIADEFTGVLRVTATVRVDEPESALVGRLEDLQDRFDVQVGSYPGDDVMIRISGEDRDEIDDAAAWLCDRVELADDEPSSPEEQVRPDRGHGQAEDQHHGR